MKKVFLFIVVCVLFSCNSDKIYQKYEKFDNNKWLKSQVLTFDVPIQDTSSAYNISLAIRHAEYYAFANILIGINQITPSGEKRYKDFNLMLRNPDGTFKGDGSGDIWDIEIPVYEKMTFNNVGTYKFVVENLMPNVETEGIMELGFVVNKAKE